MIAGPSCVVRNEDDDAMFEFATGEEIMIGLCTEDSRAGEAACVISGGMGYVPVGAAVTVIVSAESGRPRNKKAQVEPDRSPSIVGVTSKRWVYVAKLSRAPL